MATILIFVIPLLLSLLSTRWMLLLFLAVAAIPVSLFLPSGSFFAAYGGVSSQAITLFVIVFAVGLAVVLNLTQCLGIFIRFTGLTIFFLFGAMSLFWSEDPIYGIRFFLKLLAPGLFMIAVIAFLRQESDLRKAEMAIFISSGFVLVLALINFGLGGAIGGAAARVDWAGHGVLSAPYMSPANFSFLMGTAALLALGTFMTRRRWIYLALYLLYSAALLWAFTRISIAGWAVGSAICVMMLGRSNLVKWILPTTAIIGFVVALASLDIVKSRMFFSGKNVDAATLMSDPGKLRDSINTSGRTFLWESALEHFKDSDSTFGAGLGSVDSWLEKRLESRLHSEYLRLYLDVGWFGLVLYLIALGGILRQVLRLRHGETNVEVLKLSAIGIAAVTYYAITLATDNSLNYVTEFGIYVFTVIGMAFSQAAMAVRSNASVQEDIPVPTFNIVPQPQWISRGDRRITSDINDSLRSH